MLYTPVITIHIVSRALIQSSLTVAWNCSTFHGNQGTVFHKKTILTSEDKWNPVIGQHCKEEFVHKVLSNDIKDT